MLIYSFIAQIYVRHLKKYETRKLDDSIKNSGRAMSLYPHLSACLRPKKLTLRNVSWA